MAWIIFVIQLVSALPGLIKAVKEIISLIRALPKAEQKDAKKKMIAIAKRVKANKNQVASANEIDQYLTELRERVGNKSRV